MDEKFQPYFPASPRRLVAGKTRLLTAGCRGNPYTGGMNVMDEWQGEGLLFQNNLQFDRIFPCPAKFPKTKPANN